MRWTDKHIAYFKKVYPFNSNYRIARFFGCSYSAVENMAIKLNLQKDEQYRNKGWFPKGHIPWNKGTKGLTEGGKSTQFKKGHLPHNTKFDGAITVHTDTRTGRKYKYIRLSKGRWEVYSRYLWKQANGEIPEGYCVIFEDGNSLNCTLDNLKLVSRRENLNRNCNHEKMARTMEKLWQIEKIRVKYGLKPKTNLLGRCGENYVF